MQRRAKQSRGTAVFSSKARASSRDACATCGNGKQGTPYPFELGTGRFEARAVSFALFWMVARILQVPLCC